MKRTICSVSGLLVYCTLMICPAGSAGASEPANIRIGVYDNRAIACAYAPSKFNPVAEKMQAYKKAEADGDKKKCAELKAWGEKHQRQLHRQGFSKVPVDDLLAYVKDDLAALAKKKNLALITMEFNYKAPNVEIVDVTDDIVRFYNPSERTLKIVEQVKDHKPVDLDEVEQHHDH